MRILDKGNLAGSLESLCFEPQVLDIIQRSISSPFGMFLVTGPTGSGKSTTLYSCVQAVPCAVYLAHQRLTIDD